jgi:hypothetical protein
MSNQFFKGLFTALISVLITGFAVQPINWPLIAITAVSTILVYTGKNFITLLHSDSPVGSLSWVNLVSGVLIAVGTGIVESVGLYLIEGAILWGVVWKVVASATFTYLGTTFFSPQHSEVKVRVFVSPSTARALKKGLVMISLICLIPLAGKAQNPLTKGFLKPVTVESLKAQTGDRELVSAQWKLRLDASVIGMASYLKLNEEGKIAGLATPEAFSKVGAGLVFTRFDTDASRTWAAGAAFTLPTIENGRYGLAALGSYSIFRVGLNYDFGVPFKQGFCVLTGLSLDLFNLVQ